MRTLFHKILLTCLMYGVVWQSAYCLTLTGTGGIIPDYANAGIYYMPITHLDSAKIDTSYGLVSVCIHITHPRVSDIGVYLVAPDGTQVELTSGAGGSGADYNHTCFDMSASVTIISGTAPFTGTYYPRHNIGDINDGQSGIGTWRLVVQDVVQGDTGYVVDWSLTFGGHAPAPTGTPISSCSKFQASGCVCPDSTQSQCLLLPDMFIGEYWFKDTIHRQEMTDSMTVSDATANIGYGPMEIIGTGQWYCADSQVSGSGLCPKGGYAKQMVKQRLYYKDHNGFFTFIDTPVGTMSFHAELGHHHLHVDDWTENTLRIRGAESDPSLWPIVGKGDKVSMNLYDHVHCDNIFTACDRAGVVYDLYHLPNGGLGGYNSGSAQVQGISVGYADIYEQLLAFGQTIYFDSLCNGDYVLMARFDPHHRFVDMRPGNNVTWFIVTLTHQRANCCQARIHIDTLAMAQGQLRCIDRSMPIPAQWYWTFGDGDTSSAQFPYHSYTHPGYHTIVLRTTTAQGCSSSDTATIYVPLSVGIAPLTTEPIEAYLYPNPASGQVSLYTTGIDVGRAVVYVTDVLGRQITATIAALSRPDGTAHYTINTTQHGLLFVHIYSDGVAVVRRWVNE